MSASRLLGLSAIALALAYNLAFATLGVQFDYPGILRQPPEAVLAAFVQGGAALVLTWEVFTLSAVAMVPVALGLALAGRAVGPLAVTAAVLGALAGALQAMGLARWVFAVPELAALDPEVARVGFVALHAFAGVAVGEHLGQLATAGFLLAMAALTWAEGRRMAPVLAGVSAAIITAGSAEGVLLAIGADPGPTATLAVAGYLGLSLWLVVEGVARLRGAVA